MFFTRESINISQSYCKFKQGNISKELWNRKQNSLSQIFLSLPFSPFLLVGSLQVLMASIHSLSHEGINF